MTDILGVGVGGDTSKGVASSSPMQRPASRPPDWSDPWWELCMNAVAIAKANGGVLTVEDLRAARRLLRRACVDLSRQIVALELNPPRTTCRLCGEPLGPGRQDSCPECLAIEVAELEHYGDEAVDLHSFRSEE